MSQNHTHSTSNDPLLEKWAQKVLRETQERRKAKLKQLREEQSSEAS